MNKVIGNFFHEKYWGFFNHCMSLSFQNIEKDEFAQICYIYNSGLKNVFINKFPLKLYIKMTSDRNSKLLDFLGVRQSQTPIAL